MVSQNVRHRKIRAAPHHREHALNESPLPLAFRAEGRGSPRERDSLHRVRIKTTIDVTACSRDRTLEQLHRENVDVIATEPRTCFLHEPRCTYKKIASFRVHLDENVGVRVRSAAIDGSKQLRVGHTIFD